MLLLLTALQILAIGKAAVGGWGRKSPGDAEARWGRALGMLMVRRGGSSLASWLENMLEGGLCAHFWTYQETVRVT